MRKIGLMTLAAAAVAVGLVAAAAEARQPPTSHSGYCPTGTCPQQCNRHNWARNVKNCTAEHCKRCGENKR